MALPSKECTPFAVAAVTEFIDRCGVRAGTLRTDGEAAAVKLAKEVQKSRTHTTKLEQAPKHSSASLGVVERAHWEVQAQTRTLLCLRR